jgi:very-short-patch-repair endonuclease
LCEAEDLPLPEINAKVMGWEVDALWRQERVAVEVDGPGNHRTPGQIRRDRRKEFELRAANITLLRYSDDQVRAQRPAVAAEIRAALIPPARSA